MFCSNCGAATAADARFCAKCGAAVPAPESSPDVPTLALAAPAAPAVPVYVPTGLEGFRRRHPAIFWTILGFIIAVLAVVVLRAIALFLIFAGVLLSIYFAPAIVAMRRDHQVARVIVINLFFDWTLIGWVVSMAIAVGDRHPTAAV